MIVATMNIKDPAVHAAARRLAEVRGVSLTEAVRQAVDEALRRSTTERNEVWIQQMRAIGDEVASRSRAEGIVWPTDEDLYDEHGLPR